MQVRNTVRWTAPVICCLSLVSLHADAAKSTVSPSHPSKSVPKPAPTSTDSNAQLGVSAVSGAQTWALLVGISKYQSAQIASLRYPASDVSAIRDALIDPKLGGVPTDHILLLTDDEATAANINGAVAQFLQPKVKQGDRVIVFLAGHGVTKGIGADAKGFLLPTDVKGLTTTALETSAVDLRALSSNLGKLPASEFVVFVDACREDPTPGRGVKGNELSDVMTRGLQIIPEDQTRPASSATFFACGIGQRAFEDPNLKHGVFTYWILDAIRQGAVPQMDGSVDMGHLSSYVKTKVEDWCKTASQAGDFEIEQTPDCVSQELTQPVVLMRVKRKIDTPPIAPAPPRLIVDTYPAGALVSVNGKSVGSGTVTDLLASAGSYTIKAEAPGYSSVERTIQAFPGYGQQMIFRLPPGGRGVTATNTTDNSVPDLFKRALDAETREQWEVAEPGYQATIQANPTYGPGYERLSELQRRQGRIGEALATLITMTTQVPATAHTYSLLSQGYTAFAQQGPGASTDVDASVKSGDFKYPKSQQDAGGLAKKAADAAVKADPTSGEAARSLGLALIAGDSKGKNSQPARSALGKAVFLEPTDASSQYALGFGIRYFGQNIKDPDARHAELNRAVNALKEALRLRSDYYEAHRELAFTYHLMDDKDNAMHEYELANANRGKATDGNEVAGVNCALAVLDKEKADKSDGDTKQQYLNASAGYWSDAKEITPDLKKAMGILRTAGLSTRIIDYLPPQMQQLMDLPNTIKDNIMDHIKLPF